MKRTITTFAAILCCALTSCFLFSSSEAQRIEDMTPSEFATLNDDVGRISRVAGRRTTEAINSASSIQHIVNVADLLRLTLLKGSLIDTSASNDALRVIISKIDDNSSKDIASIMRDVYDLVEITVGQVRIGIDGHLSPRQITLLLTILDEFKVGLLE